MNKLFVYGCSFSVGFNDFQRPINPKYSWPYLLSNKLKHPLALRAWPGYGWNQINYMIDNDLLGHQVNYDADDLGREGIKFISDKLSQKDIIIISPSYFDRIRFKELKNIEDTQIEVVARYGKELLEMVTMQMNSFKAKVNLLNEAGYRTLGWTWFGYDDFDNSDCKYLIPAPDGTNYFQTWMEKNVKYNLIPGDTHFNEAGHEFIADYFFNFIRDGKTLDLWR